MFSDNFYPELSGIADSIRTTAEELASRGHEIHFLVPSYSAADYQRVHLRQHQARWRRGITVTRLAAVRYRTGTAQGRFVIPTLLRWLHLLGKKPDVIHFHLPLSTGVEAVVAARLLQVPLIGTNHTPIKEFIRYAPIRAKWFLRLAVRYDAWMYNQCVFVSSPSQTLLREMRKAGLRRPAQRISNPIQSAIFHPLPRKAALKKKYRAEGFTLLYIGRLAPEKHIEVLLRAVAQLSGSIPSLRLLVGGTGSEEAALRRLAQQLGIAQRTVFLGYISSLERMNEIYNAADVFVMPSTAETQSIVTMQAMACALPVIAARAWGLQEYVTKERGILVPPKNPRALAEAIFSLFQNPRKRRMLGQEGKKFAATLSPAAIAAKWEQLYAHAQQTATRRA